MTSFYYIIIGLSAAGLLLIGWMVFVERRRFRIRRIVLPAADFGLPELKLLHITDTHFYGRDEAVLAFLEGVSAGEDFDLVIFTGDIMDRAGGLASAVRAGAMFRPKLGTLVVLGGHDYRRIGGISACTRLFSRQRLQNFREDNPVQEMLSGLAGHGVAVLDDSHVTLCTPEGHRFAVVGLQDAFDFQVDFRAAWDGLDDHLPTIVMAHSPDVLHGACSRGAELAFFGHTHGGQVRIPLFGAVVTKSALPRRLASGVFRHRGTVFIINNGLGTSPSTPYRLLCRPEVVVVELRASPSRDDVTRVREAGLTRSEQARGAPHS